MTKPEARQRKRDDLRDAALRAMHTHGSAVQLNQVAHEAGLTSGAVLYHYPDLKELLLEANHAGMERFYGQRMEVIGQFTDPGQKLVAAIRAGLPANRDDPDVRLLCELGGSAGRNRVYGALLSSLYDRQVAMYQTILDSGQAYGVFDLPQGSQQIARTIVALEDAYGYRIIAGHPSIGYQQAVDLVLDYARLATGHTLQDSTAHG